jgi:hypothetical protein
MEALNTMWVMLQNEAILNLYRWHTQVHTHTHARVRAPCIWPKCISVMDPTVIVHQILCKSHKKVHTKETLVMIRTSAQGRKLEVFMGI